MKQFFLVLYLALVSIALWAVDPNVDLTKYYAGIDGKTQNADELRTKLCEIISANYNMISYQSLKNQVYAASTDPSDFNQSGGTVEDIYSSIEYTVSNAGTSAKDCGIGWNKEHTIPQSWFGKHSPMVSDAHHIFPTDIKMNSLRSNYPYGENNASKYCDKGYGNIGASTFPGYLGTVFDPGEGGENGSYKGDLARVYFYMVTRYRTTDFTQDNQSHGQVCFTYKDGVANLTAYMLNLMLDWNAKDPVSEKEMIRNNAIYTHQRNRNPFVDYPELVDYVFGDKKNTSVSLSSLSSSYSGGTSTSVTKISFAHKSVVLSTNETFQNTATANSGGVITYKTDNSSVAIVSSTGLITARGTGTCTITATVSAHEGYAEKSTTCSVSVGTRCDILWLADGKRFEQGTIIAGKQPTVPSEQPEPCTEGKVFVGWTTHATITSDQVPGDLFTSDAPIVNQSTTFYAVYAAAGGNKISSTDYKLGALNDLENGQRVIVYNPASEVAMTTTDCSPTKKYYRGYEAIIPDQGIIQPGEKNIVWTVMKIGEFYHFMNGTNYLDGAVEERDGNTYRNLLCDEKADNWTITPISSKHGNTYIMYSANTGWYLEYYYDKRNSYGKFTVYSGTKNGGAPYNMQFYVPASEHIYSNYSTTCSGNVQTEIDNTLDKSPSAVIKKLINGVLYLEYDGKIYDIFGRLL